MKKSTLSLILSLSVPLSNARGAAGSSTADFLKVSPDSRSAALGATGTADPDNGFAAFHNPALPAAAAAKLRVSAGQTQGILGVQVSHLAAAGRWETTDGSWGLAATASQWSTPSFDTTDGMGNTLGKSAFKAQTVGASFSRSWGRLSAGAGVKRITQGFDGGVAAQGSALAWDAGVFARGGEGRWTAGAVLTNVGAAAGLGGAVDRLPTAARLGVDFRPGDGRFTWSFEAAHTREKSFSVNAGMGFQLLPNLSLRAGYDGRTAGGNYAGLTSGVGLSFGDFSVDYAFAPFGDLGNVQRVSASWAIGAAPRAAQRAQGRRPVRRSSWENRNWGRP